MLNQKKFIMGLDISTAITGVVILEKNSNFNSTKHIVHYDHIDMTKKNISFWEKTDIVHKSLKNLANQFPIIEDIFVEEPLKSFRQGSSSAQVICLLQQMNGITSFLARELWNISPKYINVSSGRKALGVKIIQKKKDPLQRTAKQQTFDAMKIYDLSHIQWPTKKSGKIEQWVADVVDAYVIARSGMILYK